MPNFELMDATLKFLKARPENHLQKRWIEGAAIGLSGSELLDTTDDICGTTGCFAGWGSLIGGWHQLRDGGYTNIETGKFIDMGSAYVIDEELNIFGMTDAARQSFGLSVNQAHCLFNSYNSIDEIEQMIDWLRENPNGVPAHIGGPARLIEDGLTIGDY